MFNMENTGMKISELRKAKNMTQMELADRMNISFQAVSNWERGNSMPDVSKLPELAELLEVTIDELLGKNSGLIGSAAKGEIDEYLLSHRADIGELREAAPLLKPAQVDTVIEKMPELDLDEISDLLPFISREVTNQLARRAAESGNCSALGEVAPFISRGVTDEIACKMISEGKSIGDIAPFVSRSILSRLAETSYRESGKLSSLDDIAPFIPREVLTRLAREEYSKRGLRDFESIAPFLDKAFLSELADEAIRAEGIKAIAPIAPFLNKGRLSEYVKGKYL